MENQFVKQYPELMRGKKIMYVHGFGSSAQSGTVQMLRTLMPNAMVVARDIPLHPEEGLQMLKAMAAEEQPDLIIGTSMGGMYTEMLTGFDRILVNPAFEMGDTMSKFTGKQVFQNPREDGVQEFIVTKGLIKEYQEMTTHNFEHAADPDERTRVIALFGDNDPVVHTYDLFHEHYPTAIGFHGEHRLTDKVAMHYLIPVIRYIDDRQEGRERPVVYVDIETLRDSYGNATASMHKAYEMLIEHYNVYRRYSVGGTVSERSGLGTHRLHQPAPDALRRLSHHARRTTEAHAAGAARVHGHADRVGQRRVQDMGRDISVLRPTRRAVT